MKLRAAFAAALLLAAGGCKIKQQDDHRPATAREFPLPYRPVSPASTKNSSSEATRDDRREAQTVMDLANIKPGMTVADIGAGEGYYTVRLAARVGKRGRVLAEDIDRPVLQELGSRIERDRLDNVSIKLGAEDDAKLPPNSFDRIFMVHMYHQVSEPYALLWRMRPALRKGGQVIVVESDPPGGQQGIDARLLFCEFSHVGYRLVEFVRKPELDGYYAQFEASGVRPEPGKIEPCLKPGDDEPVPPGQGND